MGSKGHRICKKCDAEEDKGAPFPIRGLLCRKCYNAQVKQRYEDKKKHILEQKKRYYQNNKDAIAKRAAQYHQKHKEHINAQDRQEYAQKVQDKPARPCVDCGAPMPRRARMYCVECRERHRSIAVHRAVKKYRTRQ